MHLAEDLFIGSEATSRAGREALPYLDDDIPLLSVEEEPGKSRCVVPSGGPHCPVHPAVLPVPATDPYLSFPTFRLQMVLSVEVVGV